MITACIIAKNEAHHLPDCLASLQSVVDEILVVDTGSTDATPAIAENAGARVLHHPWQNNFAAARNFALDHAAQDWVLFLDADERLLNPAEAKEQLNGLCIASDRSYGSHSTYMLGTVEILNPTGLAPEAPVVLDHTPRFFQRTTFRYQGAIHEQPVPVSGTARLVSTGLRLLHLGYSLAPEAAHAKATRNLELLQSELQQHPHDEYLHYQCGKSHFSVQHYQAAATSLQAAISAIDWREAAAPRGLEGPVPRKILTDLLTTLAYTLVNLDRPQDALALLEKHAALAHPGTQRADFPHTLGYVWLILGQLDAARKAFAQSLEWGRGAEDVLGTGSHLSHYHLGLIAEAEGNVSEAWEHYRTGLIAQPDAAVLLRRIIDLSAEQMLTIPLTVVQVADPTAFHQTYVARVRHFLENAKVPEAGQLAKAAAQLSPQLFHGCREVVRAFSESASSTP